MRSRRTEAISKTDRVGRLEAAAQTRLAFGRWTKTRPDTDPDIMDRPFAIDPET